MYDSKHAAAAAAAWHQPLLNPIKKTCNCVSAGELPGANWQLLSATLDIYDGQFSCMATVLRTSVLLPLHSRPNYQLPVLRDTA
jgi:hypothetical protein